MIAGLRSEYPHSFILLYSWEEKTFRIVEMRRHESRKCSPHADEVLKIKTACIYRHLQDLFYGSHLSFLEEVKGGWSLFVVPVCKKSHFCTF